MLFFAISTMQILNAQENKQVVLNLKTGYSVKGEIIEQTPQKIKIKTFDGQVFEFLMDEILTTNEGKPSLLPHEIPLSVEKGEKILNIGVGLFGKHWSQLTFPPVPVSFEYILTDKLFTGKGALGVGGYIGFSKAKQNNIWAYEQNNLSMIVIGGRCSVHYVFIEKLDSYAGILLGLQSEIVKFRESKYPEYYHDLKETDTVPTVKIYVGCRYPFNDKIAGMAELGWGISVATIGVAIKL